MISDIQKQVRVSNRKCKSYVQALVPFKGSNLEGIFIGSLYVVLSYGWYPVLVRDKTRAQWYENKEGYSPSTKRQISEARPECVPIFPVSYEEIKQIIGGQNVATKC